MAEWHQLLTRASAEHEAGHHDQAVELARVGFEALLGDSSPQAGRMILRLIDAFASAGAVTQDLEEVGVMSGNERIARLIDKTADLPFEEREAAIHALSEEDREAVWAAELEAGEAVAPADDAELGGEA
jgi:hypothetical protein